MEPVNIVTTAMDNRAYCTHVPRRNAGPAILYTTRMTATTPALVIRPDNTALAGAGATGCAIGSHG